MENTENNAFTINVKPSALRKYFFEFVVMALTAAVVYQEFRITDLNKYIRENCLTKNVSYNTKNKNNEKEQNKINSYSDYCYYSSFVLQSTEENRMQEFTNDSCNVLHER